MIRIVVVALMGLGVSACSGTSVRCIDINDCASGQLCVMGECRATVSTGSGPGGGGAGGGSGAGGSGGSGGGTSATGCDPNATGLNATRDTDCDGLSDAEEYGSTMTDPCRADTDGDGLSDGMEAGKVSSVAQACTITPDADPGSRTNPKSADSDGDGLNDGDEDANHDGRRQATETDPARTDTDCDGYTDNEEKQSAAGCATDPTKRDTDGDGLPDGVEGGLQPPGPDLSCTYSAFTFDSDSSKKTNACGADSDGDGIQDGAEDTNLNGRADTGELDATNGNDGSGPAQQACATANLRPVTFRSNGPSDVQVALSPSFSEVSVVSGSNGEAGYAFYDPISKVAGLAISFDPPQVDATSMETAGRSRLGAVSSALTQNFTTWDGFASSVRATYEVTGNVDLKAKVNEILGSYLGGSPSGTLTGAAGVTGPFRVVAEYVWRADVRGVVVIGVVPAALYTGQALFSLEDAAGGTALAQFGDFANTQCEVFSATVNSKVDFLWVVDDSQSMQSSQTATATAASIFNQKLSNAGLDWRAAGVSTGWFGNAWDGSIRDWTNSTSVMQSWFNGSNGFGLDGAAKESGFVSAQNFMLRQHAPVASSDFRSDAQGHFIFLSDTDDQSASLDVTAMTAYLSSYFGPRRYVAHGIVCPEGAGCGDTTVAAQGRYATMIRNTGGVNADIRIFKPTNPTPAQQLQQQQTMEAILQAVIGGTGTQLQRPPISSTIKVAVAATRGTCNANDVPRDRTNGWDIDPATRRIVFFGNCIPQAAGVKVAVSYKYWNDGSPDVRGDACGGTCQAPQVCDTATKSCVCAPNCGGCSSGFVCRPATCVCEPEIG